MKSKRAFLKRPRHFEIEEKELVTSENQVLAKVKLCGLCNWEMHHFWGGEVEKKFFENQSHVLGHEWSGTVVEVGTHVDNVKIGDKVSFLPTTDEYGGFSEYALIDSCDVYKLADDVNLENAMCEPLKCIVTVLRNAAPEVGDCGAVVGCGPMGLWCIQALKGNLLGNLIAIDVDDNKLELAKKYGAVYTINPLKEDVVNRIKEINGGKLCNFVIEGTGNAKVVSNCITYLDQKGRLILMSSYDKPLDGFKLSDVIGNGIKIIPAHPSSERPDDMARAIKLVNFGTFHNEDIITHRFKLEEINKAFETLENKPKDFIKGVIEF